jgi:predicted YcjX-like family ATPase
MEQKELKLEYTLDISLMMVSGDQDVPTKSKDGELHSKERLNFQKFRPIQMDHDKRIY